MEETEVQKLPEFIMPINHEAKLKELLRNLTSVEPKLCADASKEFIKILKSDLGPEFIRAYIQTSSKLVEISQAWEFWKGKPGFLQILNLISEVLKYSNGRSDNNVDNGGANIGRVLDKFARIVIEEKMGDLYKELNSKEAKRQNAVLSLLASIVRRNSQLAWEVGKNFDFKFPIFPKLAEVRLRVKKFVDGKRKSNSTRKAFVGFAMSFLEVGHSRLLRGILQEKEMYSGVLRGLGNDDEETVVYILSILRDRVLVPESLVPTGLRSVLFGSVTLEQLVSISGKDDFGDASELAYNVLVMVCTNPVNGLMPDLERHPSPMRGNSKRLLDLMKKLDVIDVKYHQGLLLEIVKGRPTFGSAYLDEFPYNLEDVASPNWFRAISMAANVLSSVRDGLTIGFVDYREPPMFGSLYVQNIVKCIVPRPFTRLVINKGLLHSKSFVKQGALTFVLEALKLLNSLVNAVDSSAHSNTHMIHKWAALKAEIQNEVRIMLPDPQVLLSLLSPLNTHFKSLEHPIKRKPETDIVSDRSLNVSKRMKNFTANDDIDILVGGVNLDLSRDGEGVADPGGKQQSENEADIVKHIHDLWGVRQCSAIEINQDNRDAYFYSRLLIALKIYHRTMPMALEGLFDLFRFLPSNPLLLPTILQQSLLQLLNEHVCQFSKYGGPFTTQAKMYKHLHPFLILLVHSPIREIKEQAYILAKAAMFSTGAFDNNSREICAWFFFIPGYSSNHIYVDDVEIQIFQKLSSVIISFLCDAVSTTGNYLYKYMEFLRRYIHDAEVGKDLPPEVSPFIICVLEKCLRLLSSESGTFTLPQKSLISLYVCNTIKYLLDTQVNFEPLSFLVVRVLSEKLESFSGSVDVLELVGCPCELRPLKTLLHLSRNMLQQRCYGIYSNVGEVTRSRNSFINTLRDIKRVLRNECDNGVIGLTMGFSSSLVCTRHIEVLQNFPLILSISRNLLEVPFSVLASMFFLESSYLSDVLKLWPKMFTSGLESVIHGKEKKEEMLGEVDIDSMEAASMAFAFFMKWAPFCVLFSAIVQSSSLHLFEQSALQKFLLSKLTDMPSDQLISSFCNILFWINHARSSCGVGSFCELGMLSEICFILAEHLLKRLLVENLNIFTPDGVSVPLPLHCAVEVAEILFNHPAVTAFLNCPLPGNKEFSDSAFGENLEKLLEISEQGIHRMDCHALNLLKIGNELLFPICKSQRSEQVIDCSQRISRAFKALIHRLFLVFKNKFDGCIQSMDFKPLIPLFYALYSLICFISPFELFELVNWLFAKVDFHDTTFNLFSKENSLCVGLHLASCAFDILSGYMWQPSSERKLCCFLGTTDETHFNILLFEKIFLQVFEIARLFKLDVADKCLLKAVKVVKIHKVIQHPCLPSIMDLSRVLVSTPSEMISHCLHQITRTKLELLFLVAELSPQYLSVFGYMFFEIVDKSMLPKANCTRENCTSSFSDEELVMLLPTVFLYLNSTISKFGGQICKPFESVIFVYQRILLDGFSDWKTFVSSNIFKMGLDESMPSCTQEFLNYFSDSLLGKSILVLRDHLALRGDLMKLERRLSLFNSACSNASAAHDDLFDCDFVGIGLYSLDQTLNLVNRVIAKINFCRMLLLTDYDQYKSQQDNGDRKVIPIEVTSVVDNSRIQFLRLLINSWILIVNKFPENIDGSENIGSSALYFRFLEDFIMSNILDLTAECHDCLIKLNSLPFIEQLAKSFLLYRFEDPKTLKLLRTVLTSLSQGNFSCASLIQLLIGHSKFSKTVHLSRKSIGSNQLGLVLTPMQSILKSFIISRTDLNSPDCKNNIFLSGQYIILLELVKFVRVLFHINVQQSKDDCGEGIGIQSRELVYLLLSSYGATCNEVDLEIYNLILDIESNDKSSAGAVAQMDYLWGIAASMARKDWEHEMHMHFVDPKDMEAFEERRKIQFRENLPVDPKLCAQTVLYFPYYRFVNGGSLHKVQKDNSTLVHEVHSTTTENGQIYDPVFILRFSIHCLSMSYVEPTEFASLGLLAIAFVSVSSPDGDMRKLGYEALAKFRSALEKCQKKKDVARLRLLLSYLQNGIEEPWQRIPSITAVFIAEASLVLLNPSHDNYSTISKFLMNSPSVNMKTIPLFHNFFWSTSASFRTDRLWMLKLLYTGLNVEDDSKTYIRNSIFENIFSFYSSPLSDNDSQELIVQIVRKAVKLHRMAWFLVERCGLILWLSSIVSSLCWSEDRKKFALMQLPKILEVVNHITLSRNIVDWLQKHALEQLSELSSHLYKLLVGIGVGVGVGVELFKEQSSLCNSILQILTLVLKISQKRKMYQPHFTLSAEGLFQLCEALEVCSRTRCSPNMVLGLEAVLMSTPPVAILLMDKEKLSKFMRWSITTAIQSKSTKMLQPEDYAHHLKAVSGEKDEDSLVSKLLRWLVASVILGKISCTLRKLNSASLLDRANLHSLLSLLEFCEKGFEENEGGGCEDILAASIVYLLQLLSFSHRLLPSAVSALCLLLLSGSTSESESLAGLGISLPLLCTKIHCPAEANPSWRWSFYQPWRDLSMELNAMEKLDEIHSCEKLLTIASTILGKKSPSSKFSTFKDIDKFHVYELERSIFQSERQL